MKPQHWIATVKDSINDYNVVQQCYFDGTQTQARTHFSREKVLARFFGDHRYLITMQANPVLLQDAE